MFLKTPTSKQGVRIQSLSQFLTLWLRDGYNPVSLRSQNVADNSVNEALLEQTKNVVSLIDNSKNKTTIREGKAWLTMTRTTILSAANGLVTSAEISNLLKGESDGFWREFYSEDFDAAVALEASLQKMVTQMKRLGL